MRLHKALFSYLWPHLQKVGADPLPHSPSRCTPAQPPPQFKVARGLGSYHEMFCQIKCKQMTCTVDMATKQPCTQQRQQHLTLLGWAQICRKGQSSKVKESISSPSPRCPKKQIHSTAPRGLLRKWTISRKMSSNFWAVLGSMRKALVQHICLYILTKQLSISH